MNFMRLSLGIATIAVGISSCAAPANDAASTPASHDEAPSWTMPSPEPFDPANSNSEIFQPCRDVPDDVLADFGFTKDLEQALSVAPYSCPLVANEEVKQRGGFSIQGWDVTISAFENSGTYLIKPEQSPLAGTYSARMVGFESRMCEFLVETSQGIVGVSYTDVMAGDSQPVSCELPKQIVLKLYGGTNDSN